jgi:ABC-type transport system involved in multi-copper enzyme maturation permease subunit
LGALGEGRNPVTVIFVTLGGILYLVTPAMACGSISAERERKNLGLLLISRLSPLTIIAEKLVAQLVPLMVFLLLSAPLLSIAYLFGGISFLEVVVGFASSASSPFILWQFRFVGRHFCPQHWQPSGPLTERFS